MTTDPYRKVSQSPTRPGQRSARKTFDVADLYRGPVTELEAGTDRGISLDEKLRQAYFWIVNHAIISPYYDIEYYDGPYQTYTFGDRKSPLNLPSDQSYSSFVLLPILNFAVQRRCLFVGGPGRGKTASAVLMGVLAGYSVQDIRRAIQHGHPQMTIADLLGNPLPADMVKAESMENIRIAWRRWLGMRIKIIDEYNRIPTRTQSALLTVMSDNYAEMLDHIYECPPAAWYLTANDDTGGGTYPVIEALRDRIDVVVKALHFNSRFLNELLTRVEEELRPEELMPSQIIFTEEETTLMYREILNVVIPPKILRRLEFFTSQFEFCESGGEQLEYKTKDTIKLAGEDLQRIFAMETGKDKLKDLGLQTLNGMSVRALLTALVFVKAMAYFRGNKEVALEDVRQIMPFVLHDKLVQNPEAPFLEVEENKVFQVDRIGWLRRIFDLSCAEYDRLDLDHEDPVAEISLVFDRGLEGVTDSEVRKQLSQIEHILNEWSQGRKLYSHMFDDILKLKYFHQRYTNYLKWLQWKA